MASTPWKAPSDFAEGAIDVLVGTQMVTKGLDMERVTLQGILSADQLLRYPEFRSARTRFQLMAPVQDAVGAGPTPARCSCRPSTLRILCLVS
ncbi:MAG: hypothetical protein IPG69_04950 [Flavobacteriales bacterium]|nr:hypothetical protein [Flavobacteriales bacterium]